MSIRNNVYLIGRITRTPVLKKLPSGTSVVNFTLAVNSTRKDEKGNYITDFIPVVAWGRTAEFIDKYVSKGTKIIVMGSLQTRNWVDHSGNKHFVMEVLADSVEFAESKKDRSDTYNNNDNDESLFFAEEEDLPF
ncbi:single-stranded DNA-binding protein [Paraclostridium dentum]|uniref:single-stranded DNA-binding protein n=1 Tax=Paraclostridium dentum TaxID=2662455 RepID=UPI003464E166